MFCNFRKVRRHPVRLSSLCKFCKIQCARNTNPFACNKVCDKSATPSKQIKPSICSASKMWFLIHFKIWGGSTKKKICFEGRFSGEDSRGLTMKFLISSIPSLFGIVTPYSFHNPSLLWAPSHVAERTFAPAKWSLTIALNSSLCKVSFGAAPLDANTPKGWIHLEGNERHMKTRTWSARLCFESSSSLVRCLGSSSSPSVLFIWSWESSVRKREITVNTLFVHEVVKWVVLEHHRFFDGYLIEWSSNYFIPSRLSLFHASSYCVYRGNVETKMWGF